MNQFLADVVVIVHFLFILFVFAGGFLIFRWPRAAWFHLPAAAWAAFVEATNEVCPLTPLENHFSRLAGRAPYEGDFVTLYLLRVVYPEGLTASTQWFLAGLVVAVNAAVYATAALRRRRHLRPGGSG